MTKSKKPVESMSQINLKINNGIIASEKMDAIDLGVKVDLNLSSRPSLWREIAQINENMNQLRFCKRNAPDEDKPNIDKQLEALEHIKLLTKSILEHKYSTAHLGVRE